jgi:putative transposase
MLQDEFPELKKRYWGQHLWSAGYFCRTVGAVTDDMVKEYIENQDDGAKEVFKIAEEEEIDS